MKKSKAHAFVVRGCAGALVLALAAACGGPSAASDRGHVRDTNGADSRSSDTPEHRDERADRSAPTPAQATASAPDDGANATGKEIEELEAAIESVVACPGAKRERFHECPAYRALANRKQAFLSKAAETWLMKRYVELDWALHPARTRRRAIAEILAAQPGPRNRDGERGLAFVKFVADNLRDQPSVHHLLASAAGQVAMTEPATQKELTNILVSAPEDRIAVAAITSLVEHQPKDIVYDYLDTLLADRGSLIGPPEDDTNKVQSKATYRNSAVRRAALNAYRNAPEQLAERGCKWAAQGVNDPGVNVAAAHLALSEPACSALDDQVFAAVKAALTLNHQDAMNVVLRAMCSKPKLRKRTLAIARKQIRRAKEISDYHHPLEAVARCQPGKSPRAALQPYLGRGGDLGRAARRKLQFLEGSQRQTSAGD